MSGRVVPLPFEVAIVGVSYRQEAVVLCHVGDPVRVVHEPHNEFDSNACAVYNSASDRLGFIPHALAGRLASRGEQAWRGHVTEVRRGDTWGVSIRVETPLVNPAPVPAHSEAYPSETAERPVFARSGRRLGVLVSATDTVVTVRTDADVTVPYPAQLVSIDEPSQPPGHTRTPTDMPPGKPTAAR
jgi:hypothetical protein